MIYQSKPPQEYISSISMNWIWYHPIFITYGNRGYVIFHNQSKRSK